MRPSEEAEIRPLVGESLCDERLKTLSPVIYTCVVSVLRELRRTKAVLGGL
jgi:hypothetical protein